jgi:hypothetical protein
MKYLFFIFITSICFAQRNEISILAIGNFNPTSYIYIQHPLPEVISSNRSSLGAGISYQHYPNKYIGIGIQVEENPSGGKLFDHTYYIRWPLLRYEYEGFISQRIDSGKWGLSIREGIGTILTEELGGYKKPDPRASGWSHDFDILVGFNIDYHLYHNLSFRTGLTNLETKPGCYNDKTCKATWAGVRDVGLGPVFTW